MDHQKWATPKKLINFLYCVLVGTVIVVVFVEYRKILKISPGAYIFRSLFLRGLYSEGLFPEGNLCFKIDWASLIVGSKFTVFALFYFVFEGNFPSTSSQGGLYLEGRFNGGFFALPVWGACTWRGLFSEFYGIFFAINSVLTLICCSTQN